MPQPNKTEGAGKKNNVPFFSWVCSYVDALAHEYGWDDEKIIHLPFARILQYMKAIQAREWHKAGKEPQLSNDYSDSVKNQIITLMLAQKNQQNA
jgi:hypothetical protein